MRLLDTGTLDFLSRLSLFIREWWTPCKLQDLVLGMITARVNMCSSPTRLVSSTRMGLT